MLSALNVPGHGVQPGGDNQLFSTVPQFAMEVGMALQACLKDHKPGSLVYRSTVTMRANFVKVPIIEQYKLLCGLLPGCLWDMRKFYSHSRCRDGTPKTYASKIEMM